MIPLSPEAVADIVGGELIGAGTGEVTGISIDSRTTRSGDLFVPLDGEHTDGHRFISSAQAAGAVAHLCAAAQAPSVAGPGAIVVDDPLDALTGLGAWVRDAVDPLVIAITGSNGKTTTKDLTAAAIGAGRRVVANPGSFNNELGLPLTLCLLQPDTEVLVCEIGARGIGHIAQVMPMLRPDVAIVTTIAEAHIGEFGSIEAIVQAKGELVEGLDPGGVAILNADVPACAGLAQRAPGRVITVGRSGSADLSPDAVEADDHAVVTMTVKGQRVRLPLPGQHQVTNGLLALAAAEIAEVDLETAAEGLASAAVSRWRMEISTVGGVTIVNDAYNANLDSMRAALATAAGMRVDGRRIAVLGFMAELGDRTESAHRTVGEVVAESGVDRLIVVEERAVAIAQGAQDGGFDGPLDVVADAAAAATAVTGSVTAGDLVLIKASRSAGLEAVAQRLTDHLTDGEAGA
ncbi:UDP-N-acetylmuramoyl-tripeptide--D-alanyl-D-alanine ligase [Euzebya tangerina]|uniref:UDP-N-acetylmuramoyl-tripeptide--D-alanyl-D- alanine ligase n=1 Tax=Euzebya tangerina TaxID=591198 RepID=UPI000E315CF1|nr:UDP-N-acetylmuramoyl-tripeptide--D-alanyl-D-alanine ligase [Euzebya tangerina]